MGIERPDRTLSRDDRLYLAWLAYFERLAKVLPAVEQHIAANTATVRFYEECQRAGLTVDFAEQTADRVISAAQDHAGV